MNLITLKDFGQTQEQNQRHNSNMHPFIRFGTSIIRRRGVGGKDLRRTPLEQRKGTLAKLIRKASWAVQLNEHIAERGDIVFRHACKLGFEGIVSKRLVSPYVSGRSRHWVKSKNPEAPAVKRETEEDWGR
jgi:hypothetical protein